MEQQLRSTAGAAADPDRVWRSKAQTLARIAPLLRSARIPEAFAFTFAQWCAGRTPILRQLVGRFRHGILAVRSSSIDEDQIAHSQAGRFLTELGVATDAAMLAGAIDRVFRSYSPAQPEDEVLVQPMVAGVRASCVAATHTQDTCAPYFVLDFAEGPHPDAVTRGAADTVTTYIAHDAETSGLSDDERAIVVVLRELMSMHARTPLEAELVFGSQGLMLLQVRPIARAAAAQGAIPRSHVEVELAQHRNARPGVLGSAALFGLMPDWNPAELIGSHPRPLALSLFRRLISASNWRRARASLGYRKLDAGDLLLPLAGRPYVDVRLSFNSFLPSSLDSSICLRLVDAWSQRLINSPALHDKVEFEVADTCVDYDLRIRVAEDQAGILDADERQEFIDRLRGPTRACLDPMRLQDALRRMEHLARGLPDCADDLSRSQAGALSRLLRRGDFAALNFALIARKAFVAEALLRSAVRRGALSAERARELRASVRTNASGFDAWRTTKDERGGQAPGDHCGHLRPGTFEISVPTYAMDEVFVPAPHPGAPRQPFLLDASERAALDKIAVEAGIDLPSSYFVAFFIDAARGRERGKNIFSKVVSLLLDGIAQRGKQLGLDSDTLAWLDLRSAMNMHDADALATEAGAARRRHEAERRLILPPLLAVGDDLAIVRMGATTPNYQGRGIVEADIVAVDRLTRPDSVPMNCILVIESADPGFDWIFAREPAALVTAFGGPNSHMAIRCAELRCPAVLGYGVEGLRRLQRCLRLTIDFDSCTLHGAGA